MKNLGWMISRKEKIIQGMNVKFGDTCGGTEECSEKEYPEAAKRYAEIMN